MAKHRKVCGKKKPPKMRKASTASRTPATRA
ncbi:hypothetical protein GQ600_6961 [Phytophthora cactorum]|nr:hypothetical protein GQ600_6961 [Phytophthora cactorum]